MIQIKGLWQSKLFQFVDVMFHIVHSAGSLISREASTVLVERKNHRSRSECTGGVLSS